MTWAMSHRPGHLVSVVNNTILDPGGSLNIIGV
jgi:hypothetical protein